jgi:hypothetical protein
MEQMVNVGQPNLEAIQDFFQNLRGLAALQAQFRGLTRTWITMKQRLPDLAAENFRSHDSTRLGIHYERPGKFRQSQQVEHMAFGSPTIGPKWVRVQQLQASGVGDELPPPQVIIRRLSFN